MNHPILNRRGAYVVAALALWTVACDDSADPALGSAPTNEGGGTGTTTAAGGTGAATDTGTGTETGTGTATGTGTETGTGTGSGGSDPGEVRAFPGAEGFGARVTGGRGGEVLKVTTLAANGPGSLQAALDVDAPRIIVFEVSGVIDADPVVIPHGDVTIAGQTAPGGGITIRGRLYAAYDSAVQNIIVRHVRIRPEYDSSDGEQFDALQFSLTSRFMLDHLSVSSGVDETVDLYGAREATIQWSTIESSGTEGHPEGEHNYGLINGPDGVHLSVHHNLFAHHKNRCPAIANGPAEIRNNVIYDVRHGFVHHNPASGDFNMVGNYFKDGPSAELYPFWFDDENTESDTRYYLTDNWIDDAECDCDGGVNDPWSECSWDLYLDASHRASSEFDFGASSPDFVAVTTSSSTMAYDVVLARAGAFPRDIVAQASIADTLARTGSWGAARPSDLMAGLTACAAPPDSDDDGIADAWELEHGLDPNDASDRHTPRGDGYPAIEQYINELADALVEG